MKLANRVQMEIVNTVINTSLAYAIMGYKMTESDKKNYRTAPCVRCGKDLKKRKVERMCGTCRRIKREKRK